MGAMSTTCSNQRQTLAPGWNCWACGGPPHGQRNDHKARSKNCEAWTFKCGKCFTKGHYTMNCSEFITCGYWGHRDSLSRACPKSTAGGRNPVSKGSNKKSEHDVGYIFDQLCSTTER
ncbi:hypothetical protein DPMN_024242 [Dreissena polymorpha]|uniref:Uncharacterized protein n=1 Tax=Dreissena polymorpha TaxID=45954 RepID=A0A9D4RCI4_DREPO|nr:hypothetical protein DPMN_024242 [Dreissena polymorpha]